MTYLTILKKGTRYWPNQDFHPNTLNIQLPIIDSSQESDSILFDQKRKYSLVYGAVASDYYPLKSVQFVFQNLHSKTKAKTGQVLRGEYGTIFVFMLEAGEWIIKNCIIERQLYAHDLENWGGGRSTYRKSYFQKSIRVKKVRFQIPGNEVVFLGRMTLRKGGKIDFDYNQPQVLKLINYPYKILRLNGASTIYPIKEG